MRATEQGQTVVLSASKVARKFLQVFLQFLLVSFDQLLVFVFRRSFAGT